jgi:hypothetical protein
MMDTDKKLYFRKKMRIALLGEPSMMSQNKVVELCEKFFNYGVEYDKKVNASSSLDKDNKQ